MSNNIGTHHQHARKRIHKNLESYPHPDKWKNLWDKLMYFIAIIVPILTSAQVFKIWINQSAEGVSIIAWATYLTSSMAWLIYGILHKEGPIIFSNSISLLINLLVVVGAVIYG